MKNFNPGAFRYSIDFLSPPTESDDYGELIDEWSVFKSVKASKEPLLGNEYFTAMTTNSNVEVKFNTRYIEDITNKMRIQHDNDIYEILSVIDVNTEHKELLCYCKLVD
jgi:SPP1 family predicted phage head-tail adaptor